MATVSPLYGTSNQTITVTVNSLTTGSARASTAIDNTSSLAIDAHVFVTFSSATSATSATGYVAVYGYGTSDGGTNYSESITGTDAAITLTSPTNLMLLGIVNVVANSKVYKAGPFSFCKPYGLDYLPQKWGIVVVNQSAATLLSSGNTAIYQLVNATVA